VNTNLGIVWNLVVSDKCNWVKPVLKSEVSPQKMVVIAKVFDDYATVVNIEFKLG
jgi:hypothetical protein